MGAVSRLQAQIGLAYNSRLQYARKAGVAQLVERNLAKVEVESSRLFSRSRILGKTVEIETSRFPLLVLTAGWQSGYAAACKAVYAGSIPTPASSFRRSARPGPGTIHDVRGEW